MPRTIFLVDDDEDDVFMLELLLREHGYVVYSSLNPEEAIFRARQIKPDLIILDIVMPRLDGAELSRRLKENPRTQDIPVLFLTALKTPEDDIHPVGQPTNVVLAKPVNARELLAAIRQSLNESPVDKEEGWNRDYLSPSR